MIPLVMNSENHRKTIGGKSLKVRLPYFLEIKFYDKRLVAPHFVPYVP